MSILEQVDSRDNDATYDPISKAKPDYGRKRRADFGDDAANDYSEFEQPWTGPFASERTVWDVYNNEARIVDRELVKDWTSSLNSLLLFAAIFAAVLTAFIIESKKYLGPEPEDATAAMLLFLINNMANGTHLPYQPSEFHISSWAISVNCLLFASLSSSIVAALASVVALQWVAEYDAAISRGGSSPMDRMKRRQLRFGGVEWWKMGDIIAALPILLYCSVLLFFAGLAQWMFAVHDTIGIIITLGGVSSALFYFVTGAFTVLSPSAPFRTPLSRWVYSLLHFISSMILYVAYFVRLHFRATTNHAKPPPPTLQERDNCSVKSQSHLVGEGLIWLSNHISISPDSHHRLVLLLEGTLALPSEQLSSRAFLDCPWWEIFDEVGARYVQRALSLQYTERDLNNLKILLRCTLNEGIRRMIHSDSLNPHQLPEKRDGGRYRTLDMHSGPSSRTKENATYLLFAQIPTRHSFTSLERQVTFRLAQWFYMSKEPVVPGGWREHLAQVARSASTPQGVHLMIIRNSHGHVEGARPESTLRCLLDLFGLISITFPPTESNLPLPAAHHPVAYRLHAMTWIDWPRVEEVSKHMNIHSILKSILHAQIRNPSPTSLWEPTASADEVEEATSAISVYRRDVVASSINSLLERYGLIQCLRTFDNLIMRGCEWEEHQNMISLILCELDAGRSLPRGQKDIDALKDLLPQLHDSSLRLICSAIAGVGDWHDEWINSALDEKKYLPSWNDTCVYFCRLFTNVDQTMCNGRLLLRLWHCLTVYSRYNLLCDAMTDIDILKYLERCMFHPDLGVTNPGDFLLVCIYMIQSGRVYECTDTLPLANWESSKTLHLVLALLMRHEEDPMPRIKGGVPIDMQCFEYVARLCGEAKKNDYRLMNILIGIMRKKLCVPSSFVGIIKIAKQLQFDNACIPPIVRHELVQALHTVQNESWNTMDWINFWDTWGEEGYPRECGNVKRKLLEPPPPAQLSRSARASISCMRSSSGGHAAMGWFEMHEHNEVMLPLRNEKLHQAVPWW